MQIAQVIGGYTLGGADLLRRAMGKKDPAEMARSATSSSPAPQKNGIAGAKATQLFDLMEKFAGYGFNKSHAAAYALVAYQTAYFKAHHPAAFMAANLSLVMDDTDKVRQLLRRRARAGARGAAARRQRVELPLRARRREAASATGWAASRAPASRRSTRSSPRAPRAARSATCSTSAAASTSALVNRRVVEALIRAGAFDAIDARRATLFASVGVALGEAERAEAVGGAGVAVRRGAARGGGSRWSPRANGRKPSGSRTKRRRSASTCRAIRTPRYAAELAQIVRQPLANLQPKRGADADRRHRHRAARAGEQARQDGVRHAGRRRRHRPRSSSTTRPSTPRARCCARTSSSSSKSKVSPRMTEDGQVQGLRIIAESVYDLAAIRKRHAKGAAPRVQRQRRGRPAVRAARALSQRHAARSSSSTAIAASPARSSCPTTGG